MSPCYTASAVTKVFLILSLLLAVPVTAGKVKAPSREEMMVTIKNLEDTVEEQQERLRIHKSEIDALRKTVAALESRLSSLEECEETTPKASSSEAEPHKEISSNRLSE